MLHVRDMSFRTELEESDGLDEDRDVCAHNRLSRASRMSGASGKVPAAIHLVPEAAKGGLLSKVANGDIIRVDAVRCELSFMGDLAQLEAREVAANPNVGQRGCGRELFAVNRNNISNAEQGASFLFGEG